RLVSPGAGWALLAIERVTSGFRASRRPSKSVKVMTCREARKVWFSWYRAYSSNWPIWYLRQPAASYRARSPKEARSLGCRRESSNSMAAVPFLPDNLGWIWVYYTLLRYHCKVAMYQLSAGFPGWFPGD